MMPELGKYAAEVLSAYAVTITLMVALLLISLRQSARTRRALRDVEAARKNRSGKESATDV
ncbi:heme exporter protein CcmD [Aliiruegeria sabulilitoris]|uniref:heme exporter protein CcmD n=1 Tax=Aliiruegeria sabulilitoris TaxID=1510458 RepID=UPI000832375C|nr:heme exporter protein CcmD [Aliiruegeria sabulilitoris]NDR55115.1 heme exporter protein CcmD [Pseudoruegeria sp. M32A2M]